MMSAAGRVVLLALALAIAIGGDGARGQTPEPGEAAKAMVGTWEFANADRDRVCSVTFRADAVAGGARIEFERPCFALYPFLKEVAAWRMAENDFLRLVNERGDTLLDFSEVESGVFEAPRPGEGILFIQKAGAAGPAPRDAEQIAGVYQAMRAGKPVCGLELDAAAAGADRALRVLPPCETSLMRFAPTIWTMERDELVLRNARGQIWRFEEADAGIWRRVPQGDGLTLQRK